MENTTAFQQNAPFQASEKPETDFEVRTLDAMCGNQSDVDHPFPFNLVYALIGIVFGVAFYKTEIISWFRIQEMFRLQSFHMYGVIGTGVVIGALSVYLIKRFHLRTLQGETIEFQKKTFNKGQVIGGLLFGAGWALTGACPGPLFAQVGTGAFAVLAVILSAMAGTYVYALVRNRLPQ